eukprot:TRINITY_DN55867_c0_g1_i1.p1 TRINITY_DN55867_c0_g1~~TRINITY_DN55867_c0_g1_i1.p1  ORF type:complete len:484 (-),score=88.83 TRINITY_DN55867_c0_g1_i1:36-1319(-)
MLADGTSSGRRPSDAGSNVGATTIAELALEAWADCKPQGYVLDEEQVPVALPQIAAYMPNRSPGMLVRDRDHLFVSRQDGVPPIFLQLLRAQAGKVHFLYFWRAFCEAARMGDAEPADEDGLTSELHLLRDRILRKFEEVAIKQDGSAQSNSSLGPLSARISAAVLMEESARAATMSSQPRFWKVACEMLNGPLSELADHEGFTIDEVTSVLLSWLHDAASWEHFEQRQRSDTSSALERATSFAVERAASFASMMDDEANTIPVRVHVYDVSQEEGIQKLNRVLAHRYSPIKLGGVFHAGVEVNGLEWSFGYSESETRPGISCVEPKTHPQHHYRQTVNLRRTKVPPEDIADIITALIEEYPGDDYDLLRRNCCHFADDFCKRLGVGGIPSWVHRLARIGAGVDAMIQAAPNSIKDRIYGLAPGAAP